MPYEFNFWREIKKFAKSAYFHFRMEQKSLHVIRSLESSATLASVSFRGRQGGTGVGSTPGTSLEASPTDRVEKLLKKYSVSVGRS